MGGLEPDMIEMVFTGLGLDTELVLGVIQIRAYNEPSALPRTPLHVFNC